MITHVLASSVSVTTVSTVILAITAIVGLLFAGIGWLYKRGADERELTMSIKQHTTATDNLATSVDKLSSAHADLEHRVDNHETRISVNEHAIATNARDISKLWPLTMPSGDRTRENVSTQTPESP